MAVPEKLRELVSLYEENRTEYRSGKFNETQARIQFINPLFELLGWDVSNKNEYAELYKDVVHEDAVKIGGRTKAPDYSFRIGGARKFFLEAKKPVVPVTDDIPSAYQLRRYGWSAKLSLSVLSNFEDLAIYDCRIKPEPSDKASKARVKIYHFKDYVEHWDEIYSILSKESVLRGSFDKFSNDARKKRGTAQVDDAFLDDIESWREALAKNIFLRNKTLSIRELNTAVQRTIDRIVFLRIAEDRGIEPYGTLGNLKGTKNIYAALCELFRKADARYNSGLFHFDEADGSQETLDNFTLTLKIDDKVLHEILKGLYYPDSPYVFSVLSADILGQVYEQFLGKVISHSKNAITITEKPEVKKAGGVYYTPSYIAEFIVENTIGKWVSGRTPNQVSGNDARVKDSAPLRIIDPACGSGSFLIVAYQYLLNWYCTKYVEENAEKHAKGRDPKLYYAAGGEWRLTIAEKRRILTSHIFGVDIDPQAVEVTKLSLLLKVLEGENGDVVSSQMDLFKMRVLPDLGKNIKCGNSLIGDDFYELFDADSLSLDERLSVNTFNWDREFFKGFKGKFDILIGNPPYLYSSAGENKKYFSEHYKYSQYQTDFYQYFIEKSYALVKDNGVISYIVPDSWLNSSNFSNLRKLMVEVNGVNTLVFFDYLVFKSASIENTIFIGSPTQSNSISVVRSPAPGVFTDYAVLDTSKVIARGIIDPRYTEADEKIIAKVDTFSPASERYDINRGLHAYRTDGYGKSAYQDGPQTKADKDKRSYHSEEKLNDTYLPEIRGRDVGFFDYCYSGSFISYGDWLAEPRPERFMRAPKVVLRKTLGRRLSCAIIEEPAAVDQALYIAISKNSSADDLKLLAGLAGSTFGAWYIRTKYAIYDRLHPWYTKKNLADFPIPESTSSIISVYEKITSKRARFKESKLEQERNLLLADIERLEASLDDAVFNAYGLTDSEKAVVLSGALD